MRYTKFVTTVVVALMALPVLGAEKPEKPKKELDIDKVVYIENHNQIELGFDTAAYLPEDFNPYKGKVTVESINYIEKDKVKLGFDTSDYLPEGFNPYK